ncbi:hypothetical protein OAE25_00140 [Verrucomicrobiales bacterium]|jgi:hypothetical protein|nr:hypothetical protein [Verrucomicrobiales bacterium]|tara:strand:+ start:96 stop:395 length:300 start_codon:yes stop_codon:yes gene_type:complete
MAISVTPNRLKLKNEYRIFENEIVCKITDNEFNYSQNPTITTDESGSLRNFATGSDFKPYATTVGLYNEANELLLVGKLGQPIPLTNNNNTTFIIRFDK